MQAKNKMCVVDVQPEVGMGGASGGKRGGHVTAAVHIFAKCAAERDTMLYLNMSGSCRQRFAEWARMYFGGGSSSRITSAGPVQIVTLGCRLAVSSAAF